MSNESKVNLTGERRGWYDQDEMCRILKVLTKISLKGEVVINWIE